MGGEKEGGRRSSCCFECILKCTLIQQVSGVKGVLFYCRDSKWVIIPVKNPTSA